MKKIIIFMLSIIMIKMAFGLLEVKDNTEESNVIILDDLMFAYQNRINNFTKINFFNGLNNTGIIFSTLFCFNHSSCISANDTLNFSGFFIDLNFAGTTGFDDFVDDDTNESLKMDNIISFSCGGDDKISSFDINANPQCTADIDTDTNAGTECNGDTTYLDGNGNCDDISAVYLSSELDPVWLADRPNYINETRLGNITIVRAHNASWITDNQVYWNDTDVRLNNTLIQGSLTLEDNLTINGKPVLFNISSTEYMIFNDDNDDDLEILYAVDGGTDYMNLCMDDTDNTFKFSDSPNCETNVRMSINPGGTVAITGTLTADTAFIDDILAGNVFGSMISSPTMTTDRVNADAYAVFGKNPCTGTNCYKVKCDGSILAIHTILTQTCGGICGVTQIRIREDGSNLAVLSTVSVSVSNTEFAIRFSPDTFQFDEDDSLSVYVDLGSVISGATSSTTFDYECNS